jgi:cell division protein FtsN
MLRKQPMRHSRAVPRTRQAGRGSTLLGIFIGLVLGLSIAAAVAFFLGRSGLTSPLQAPATTKEPARTAKGDVGPQGTTPDKPRFDFYKILPGAEEPRSSVDRRAVDKGAERSFDKAPDAGKATEAAKPADRYWLQAGAFASASDAENMKARLALSGWEASIQAVSLPDKTVRYRVRLGPYDNTDELGRVKTELGSRGFDVAVIKNQ